MTRRPDIVISIINYRTADLTIACLRSALNELHRAAGQGILGHVVVVDNASGDGSADTIADWLMREAQDAPVTLLRSETNTGFSGGHNLSIAHLDAEFYLLLNSDGLLRPGFVPTLLAAARARPRMGLFAPRIEHDDGTPQVSAFRFATPMSEFIRGINSGPVTKLLQRHLVAIGTDPEEVEIEWASFACILLSGAMIGEIGPMDEGYFLYFEDAEYCLRARRAGWHIGWTPEARMVHFRGGSGPVKALSHQRKRMPGYFYASRARFLYQAHGRSGLILANLMWLLGRGLSLLRLLTGRRIRPAVEAEARDIWINAFKPLGPRRAPHEIAREAAT